MGYENPDAPGVAKAEPLWGERMRYRVVSNSAVVDLWEYRTQGGRTRCWFVTKPRPCGSAPPMRKSDRDNYYFQADSITEAWILAGAALARAHVARAAPQQA
jgi:hypothetical protein